MRHPTWQVRAASITAALALLLSGGLLIDVSAASAATHPARRASLGRPCAALTPCFRRRFNRRSTSTTAACCRHLRRQEPRSQISSSTRLYWP